MSDTPQVKVTARYLLDHDLWTRACEVTGLSEWAVNEGRMDAADTVTLTIGQAHDIGLLDVLRRAAETPRPQIVRAMQNSFGCPADWDAWDSDGHAWNLRFRYGHGDAQREDLGDGQRLELSFTDDDNMAGVISLEEFCERAGLALDLEAEAMSEVNVPMSAILAASTDRLLMMKRAERQEMPELVARSCDHVIGRVVEQVRTEFPDADGRLLMAFAAALQEPACRLEEMGRPATAEKILSWAMFAAEQIDREVQQ